MEAHFVHQNQATGDLVVLAVLMSQGDINQPLANIWREIPYAENRQSEVSDLVINALQLLPENKSQYYRYQGSLTTPSLLGDRYLANLKQPVEVSPLQIARFLEVIGTKR